MLCKKLGLSGKIETSGKQVAELYENDELDRIDGYCLLDVLQTYLLFLRTQVLKGIILPNVEKDLKTQIIDKITVEYAEQYPEIGAFITSL